jgi:hypothetical protein
MKRFRGRQPDPEPQPGLDPELETLMALEEAERRAEGGGVPVEEDPELQNLLDQEEFERSISGPQSAETDPEILELLRVEEEERRRQQG